MVSKDDEIGIKQRRKSQEYSLLRIKELASQDGTVSYASTRVQYDVDNLGYSLSDVHECLNSLDDENYMESVLYENLPLWHDIYRINYRGPNGQVDELYIKLTLNRDLIMISLHSFHRDRSI